MLSVYTWWHIACCIIVSIYGMHGEKQGLTMLITITKWWGHGPDVITMISGVSEPSSFFMWPLNCSYWKSLIDSVWSPRCTCTPATVNIYERPKLDNIPNRLLFLSLSMTSDNDPQRFVQLRKLCCEYLLVDMYYWYCLIAKTLCCQPNKCYVRKSLSTNMYLNMSFK